MGRPDGGALCLLFHSAFQKHHSQVLVLYELESSFHRLELNNSNHIRVDVAATPCVLAGYVDVHVWVLVGQRSEGIAVNSVNAWTLVCEHLLLKGLRQTACVELCRSEHA